MSETININFGDGSYTPAGNWNQATGATTTGTKVANLIDDTGASTGRSLTLDVAFVNESDADARAVSGTTKFPEEACDSYWYDNLDQGQVTISATTGEDFTIWLIGHPGTHSRNTVYGITGTASGATYTASGTTTPNDSVSTTGTVVGNAVTVDVTLVSTFAYLSGIIIEFASTSIDTADSPITDGEQDNAFTVSGFGGSITSAKLVDVATGNYEYDASASLAGTYTYDYQDVANLTSDTLGTPFDSASHTHNLEVSDGTDTATTAVVINPATGWTVVEVASAVKTEGSVFENFIGTILDTCQVLYPTANNTSVDATGILTTDQLSGSISMVFYDISDYKWKPFTVIVGSRGTRNRLLLGVG